MATIAVVDDDPGICKALRRLFRTEGFAVTTFPSAEDLLGSLTGNAPDCLILDMQLPGLSGLDLQQHLADHGYHIPIVFITAYADEETRSRALLAGAYDFFAKPFDRGALLDAVARALNPSGEVGLPGISNSAGRNGPA